MSVIALRNITTSARIPRVIKGNDILVLVRLASVAPKSWTFRAVAESLGMDVAAVHRSVGRLSAATLLDADRQVNRSNLEEFLLHGLRFILPAELGPVGRGRPTAWGVEPLRSLLAESGEPPPVWPDPNGVSRGPQVEPIAGGVLKLADSDPELGVWFALLDAMRVGRVRDKELAANELRSRIWAPVESAS